MFAPFVGVVLGALALGSALALPAGTPPAAPRTDACDPSSMTCVGSPHTGEEREQAEGAYAALAEKYRPVIYTKMQSEPCNDDGEAYVPVAVDVVLGNPAISLNDQQGNVVTTAPRASDLYGKSEDHYLDFPGDPRHPGCAYEEDFRAFAAGERPAVYAHVVVDDERDQIALQYWLYFYFNDWNNKHESDWEFIQLVFDGTTEERALDAEPRSLVYAQHGGGERANWSDDKVRKEDGRPVIFTPQGSHGSLYGPDVALGKGEAGTGFGCDDASPPSRRIDPDVFLVPQAISGPQDPFAWLAYEGRWGERVSGEFNGPTGPNTKRPWSDPLAWQDEQRTDSVTVPEHAIGPNAANVFCGVVAGGSRLILRTGPYLVLGLVFGAILSTGVTARRTRFRPASSEPLRQRRRFGQILGAAFRVLVSKASLFLVIGAVFVPAGIIAAVIQRFIIGSELVEPILDTVDHAVANGLVALALGSLGFGIVYWLVLVAVIAALSEIDSSGRANVGSVIAHVWRRKLDLLSARLRALAILALLGISVAGIPFAIWQGVRWTFLEQAILFDRASARDARVVSARCVRGDWWRTLGFTLVVGYGAIALGPMVAIGVLLFTGAPVAVVNVISSVIYVMLVPYAAIGFTMFYLDLKLAHEDAVYSARASSTAVA